MWERGREATLEKDKRDAQVTRQRKLPERMLSHLEDDISLSALCRVLKGQEWKKTEEGERKFRKAEKQKHVQGI